MSGMPSTQWIRRLRAAQPARTAGSAAAVLALIAAVVVIAPGWWADVVGAVGMWLLNWWLVLLLLAVAGGLAFWLGWPRQWLTALRRPREEDAALPLPVHVTVLLIVTFVVTALTGTLLWLALGSPNLAPGTSTPTSAPPPGSKTGWSAQNTFDGLRAVLSVVAGIGAVVALTVAYRRQRHHEAAERRENTKLLNERFAKAAELLGGDQAAVRLSGVYAMAALADDWTAGRQTCIDVLCAYIRMPYEPQNTSAAAPVEGDTAAVKAGRDPREERQVRHTIIRLIRDHLRPTGDTDRWHGRHFDLVGAVFDGGDLSGIHVTAGTSIDLSAAKFSGGPVRFSDVKFSGGTVIFNRAEFSGGTVNFSSAEFSGGTVNFNRAEFSGSMVNFSRARFSSRFAEFSDGTVDFSNAKFSGSMVIFHGAEFTGGAVLFHGAEFTGGAVLFEKVSGWTHPPVGIDGSELGVRWPSPV